MPPLPVELVVVLVGISLLAGIGCTTTGAGGIFVTIALYVFTPLSSAEVAGTAHVVFVAVGFVGAIGFTRSGELLGADGRALAVILSTTSVLGAVSGAYLNAYVSRRLFSILLGTLTAVTGLVLLYGQFHDLPAIVAVDTDAIGGRLAFGSVGLFLGVASGLVGIGGPILAVPVLVTLGVPLLLSLGVAQVQAIFISGFAAGGYFAQDAISPFFAALTGIPTVVGAVGGWIIAHHVDPDHLELVLGGILIPTGLYLLV
ncbi:sulfite exporter TauE/SafE family protein [Natronolimnohabitans sp. A-GB9]|uniref:sulfite exporter TauE/SafE family protein n=1 Tax=Natronolimnohabitans sp. A-GB9 TaxID=3069757 RepID=UPI0027B18BDE|nr:sulfite exporter TauE/SafE family protein [Natronolimnohabitans sp. A-GB9]MDQ2052376.1 sulfite exporter TauE/SafE family protein [Natronolimnohabitans sp. A-GB9]